MPRSPTHPEDNHNISASEQALRKFLQSLDVVNASSVSSSKKNNEVSHRRLPIDPKNSFREVDSPYVVPESAARKRGGKGDSAYDASQDESEGDWVLSGDELGVSSVEEKEEGDSDDRCNHNAVNLSDDLHNSGLVLSAR